MKSKNLGLKALTILPFFFLMSGLDYIVHGTLYSYGLVFNYAWAYPYWILYAAIFIVVCLLARSGLGLALTVGGFMDILTSTFWPVVDGKSIGWFVFWWWSPFSSWLRWTLVDQIVLCVLVLVGFSLLKVGLVQKPA